MARVDVKQPVYDFVRRQAPEPRRALKKALRDLGFEKGDIRSLEQALAGYHRLRVGKFRIIFRYVDSGGIEAIFAEERSMVYEVFESQLLAKLKS
jgi:mRNA-degrading endonuclease RelE of RelBE toxin-antitoxin system